MTTKVKVNNSLFKNRNFMALFAVQFFSALNSNVLKSGLLFYLTYQTQKDNQALVAISTGLFILPFFLFSATAGQVADKFKKNIVLRCIKVYGLFTILLFAIFFYAKLDVCLTFVVFLVGIESAFVGPIKYSLIPEIVPEEKLLPANSLIESLTFFAILCGTLFGSVALSFIYGDMVIIFVLVLVSLLGITFSFLLKATGVSDDSQEINYNLFSSTYSLLKYCYSRQNIWIVIIFISWFWMLGIVLLTDIPFFVKEVVNGERAISSLLLVLFSVGIAIGTYICTKVSKVISNYKVIIFSSCGISVSLTLLGLSAFLFKNSSLGMDETVGLLDFISSLFGWLIIVSFVSVTVFSGMYTVPLYTAIQHIKDRSYLSRVVSINNILNALFMVVGSVFIYITEAINVSFVGMFTVLAIMNIYFLVTRKNRLFKGLSEF